MIQMYIITHSIDAVNKDYFLTVSNKSTLGIIRNSTSMLAIRKYATHRP